MSMLDVLLRASAAVAAGWVTTLWALSPLRASTASRRRPPRGPFPPAEQQPRTRDDFTLVA
jgi:hypothetical protein